MYVVAIMAVMHWCWSLNKISPAPWIRAAKRFNCNILSASRVEKKKKKKSGEEWLRECDVSLWGLNIAFHVGSHISRSTVANETKGQTESWEKKLTGVAYVRLKLSELTNRYPTTQTAHLHAQQKSRIRSVFWIETIFQMRCSHAQQLREYSYFHVIRPKTCATSGRGVGGQAPCSSSFLAQNLISSKGTKTPFFTFVLSCALSGSSTSHFDDNTCSPSDAQQWRTRTRGNGRTRRETCYAGQCDSRKTRHAPQSPVAIFIANKVFTCLSELSKTGILHILMQLLLLLLWIWPYSDRGEDKLRFSRLTEIIIFTSMSVIFF